ncbi:MSF1-domain-containing protein [Stereum hirsutum FP-91666 SS1]|uniref:MSF1-domain-containing protein n=1 Tax=Stereum hirsutum (strain FP-91666) TaxID=721885 RepID=UPI00044491F6|nr:MSF1-domain-containing protein [Stereum hirsutum FP-91666 SS1]EIM83405.1 MSF1-domain-containing protein [Stereum hirsutum FP-91666 SS1]
MRYFSQQCTYDHSWAHVIIGMWHKYPNPHCSHVVSVDVVDRSVNPQTGIIRTERIVGCTQRAPLWIVKLFGGSEDAFVREISFVDPATQTTSISTVNLSLSQFATCHETIRYSPTRDGRTDFTQTAEIEARMAMWRAAADKLEGWLAQRFEQNAHLGKVGFTDVLRRLWEDAQEQQPARASA